MTLDHLLTSVLEEAPTPAPEVTDYHAVRRAAARRTRRRIAGRVGLVVSTGVVALLVGRMVVPDGPTTTETVGPMEKGQPSASGPAPSTRPAENEGMTFVLPPIDVAGHHLDFASPTLRGAPSSDAPTPASTRVGRLEIKHHTTLPALSVRYAWDSGGDPVQDLPLKIEVLGHTTVDGVIEIDAVASAAEPTTMANGWQFVDAGTVCAADGARQVVNDLVVTFSPCRQIALAWRGDVTVVADAPPATDLQPVLGSLQLVDADGLRDGLVGVQGGDAVTEFADRLRAGESQRPTVVTPTSPGSTASPIDSDLCAQWRVTRAIAGDGRRTDDPELLENTERLAAVAPADLAPTLRELAEDWRATYPPSDHSTTLMARVVDRLLVLCPADS